MPNILLLLMVYVLMIITLARKVRIDMIHLEGRVRDYSGGYVSVFPARAS